MSEAWSLENVQKLRDEIRAGGLSTPVRDERFHAAAALVSSFELTPGTFTGEAAANLVADSVQIEGSRRWTLKNSVRRRVLKQLHTRDALQRALDATPVRPDDPLQRAIDACVTGSMKALSQQTAEELAASMQVVDWLGVTDLKESLPAIDAVRKQVEYAALVDPLRALAGSNFQGRKTKLATLASYVEPDIAAGTETLPMLIFGPGGMGKSSLIAKFVLDRIGRLPIVYLDCDRPGLTPQEPVTFLAEAVRQLGLQFNRFRSPAEKLRSEWLRAITLAQTSNADTRGRTVALDEFRVFINDVGLAQSPVLFAIDTFEEVQYRSRSVAREVAEFLSELRERLPRLRTVIAGRNPTPEFKVQPLELGELDQEASRGLLASLGVESSELQSRLARLLHGNPLSLRLAAEIIGANDSKGWSDIEGLTDDTAIQGVLYGRILSHVHNGGVKKIAHPGLILRRITPDLIRDVLAGPCGVRMDDPKYADTLFTLLRKELSLIVPEVDAVRHRSDVRRVMLKPLRDDRKDVVRQIEEAAIEYYTPFDDVTSRAEEIYHRLSLGQSRKEIDRRWLHGIEDSLRSALEELPKPSRAYLANRLRVELYDQDWDAVDQKTWEEYAARQSQDLLRLDRPLEAVRLLRSRSVRQKGSPLYWLHAQALRRGGQVLESREVARQGIEDIAPTGSPITAELLDWFTEPELHSAPSADHIQRQLERIEILRSLRSRSSVFVDRERELRALGSYVFARGPTAHSMLAIVGPGGIGKSALVIKLDRLNDLDLVYIDTSTLPVPASGPQFNEVWAEAYRQLCLIRPELRAIAERYQPGDPKTLRVTFGEIHLTRPLVMVIDGVEGLRFPDGNARQFHGVLEDLQVTTSGLRVVLTSRVRPEIPNLEVIELTGLPTEAAEALLSALDIESIDALHKVLAVAGSSPLTLKLAAELVRQSGPESLEGLTAEPDLAPYLLNRILDRIPNIEVRALVRSALAVRQVTAEVIELVLAGPSQLEPGSRERRKELLHLLASETSLFEQIAPGVIRPRPDFRQLFRRSISSQAPFAKAIDEAAIAYYQTRNEPESRAEEIFHRIMAGNTPEEIDGRWVDGVEPFLQDAASDVSGPMRTYLAVRLGFADVDIDPATADQATWERYVVKRAKALIDAGKLAEALDLVRQRSTRMRRSPLYVIEAQILVSMNRAREALVVGRRGLELWPDDAKLALVVAAAERAVDPAESTQQAAAPKSSSSSDVFYLLGAVGINLILPVLKHALPTATDVMNAVRFLRGAAPSENLEKLVEWAASTHRLDELITAAAQYAPDDPELAKFLAEHAKRVEASARDPISRVLLERGEVFLNRQILRDFLRGLVSGEARSRVLVVNGPRGCGKSYTGVLADSIAQATGRLEYRRSELSGWQTGMTLIGNIFDAFQWRGEMVSPSTIEPMMRHFEDLANVIRRKAQETRAIIVLHVDISEEPRVETLGFLNMLIREPGQLAVILSGLSKAWLQPGASTAVMFEDVAHLSLEDIEDGLTRVHLELNCPVSDGGVAGMARTIIAQVEQLMIARGPDGDEFNTLINQAVKTFVIGLAQ